MPFAPLINTDDIAKEPDFEKLALDRIPSITQLTTDFIQFVQQSGNITITPIDDINEYLAYKYYAMCYEHVKPVIEDRANRYKMASIMELIIVDKQVLKCDTYNENENKALNADFAMGSALSLISCMINKPEDLCFFNTDNATVNENGDRIIKNHKTWLISKPKDSMPIFINAQFYELLELLHVVPLQMHAY